MLAGAVLIAVTAGLGLPKLFSAPPSATGTPVAGSQGGMASMGMGSMQEHMQAMHEQMARIQATTDPQEKQRLMKDHMEKMQAMMAMMTKHMGGMGGMQQGSMGMGDMGGMKHDGMNMGGMGGMQHGSMGTGDMGGMKHEGMNMGGMGNMGNMAGMQHGSGGSGEMKHSPGHQM
jgi:hypothetical protein